MSVLLHDGRRAGHLSWLRESLAAGLADGAVLNAFFTPQVAVPRNPSAADIIAELRGQAPAGQSPEILFDSATWAATLPGTDLWATYGSWPLWPRRVRSDLSDAGAVADHVRAVFDIQRSLGVPLLAPTVTADTAAGTQARLALDIAAEAKRQEPDCLLTICGINTFWRAGPALDRYVGQLARLRPAGWYVIPLRDRAGYPADMTDSNATAGWLRTIHSLALRNRVIAAHTDHLGVAAAVAGASTVGTGWDQAQRACSGDAFRDGGGGTNVNYSPHPGLLARFTETVARGLRDLQPAFAEAMRWGEPIPTDMRAHRVQHFQALREQFDTICNAGPTPSARAAFLRNVFTGADIAWDYAIGLGAADITAVEKATWFDGLRAGFELYALAEGI